jgi:hypothetical protein
MRTVTARRTNAEELAGSLDLDVDEIGICQACLSFVSFPLELGDEKEVRRALRHFAPVLWDEGLALPLQAGLQKARRAGITGAENAIADVERRGPRAAIVPAVIRRLAADLTRRSRADLERLGFGAPASVAQLRPRDRE